MVVPEKGNLTEKYLGAIGIEDPFAVPYCLNSQITLNPKRFRYNKKEEYYEYLINKDNFFYAGDNGFLIRKKDFDENKGYTQDIDNFYRMALSGKKYKVAVPKNLRIFHHTSSSFIDMIKKRGYYVRFYLLKNIQNRDFYWFNLEKNTLKQNLKFLENILFNLLIFPSIIDGISMSIKEKKVFWLVHPFMMFAITMNYLLSFSYAKIFKKI